MIALLTASLFFEILVHVLNCISKSAREKLCSATLKGKSMIINTLGASGLGYTATVVNMLDWVHTRVSKAIWDFLWNGKTELVKRDTCRLPWQHGGLSVINPLEKSQALKLWWVSPVGNSTCEKMGLFCTLLDRLSFEPLNEGLGVSPL